MTDPQWVIRVCEHGYQLVYVESLSRSVHANTQPVQVCSAPHETQRAVPVVGASAYRAVVAERDRRPDLTNEEMAALNWAVLRTGNPWQNRALIMSAQSKLRAALSVSTEEENDG